MQKMLTGCARKGRKGQYYYYYHYYHCKPPCKAPFGALELNDKFEQSLKRFIPKAGTIELIKKAVSSSASLLSGSGF
jgi:hypothetical protein